MNKNIKSLIRIKDNKQWNKLYKISLEMVSIASRSVTFQSLLTMQCFHNTNVNKHEQRSGQLTGQCCIATKDFNIQAEDDEKWNSIHYLHAVWEV